MGMHTNQNPCWTWNNRLLNDESAQHFDGPGDDAYLRERNDDAPDAQEDLTRYAVHVLPRPCVVLTCDCCHTPYGEEEAGATLHGTTVDELCRLALDGSWTTAQGLWVCNGFCADVMGLIPPAGTPPWYRRWAIERREAEARHRSA